MTKRDQFIGVLLRELRFAAAAETLPAMSTEDFAEYAHRLAGPAPHVILLSGGTHDCSRRSIAFLRPVLTLRYKDGTAVLTAASWTRRERADPFALLQSAQKELRTSFGTGSHAGITDPSIPEFPPAMIGGYVAYEAARAIERLPANTADDLLLPDLFFLWPSEILIRDHAEGTITRLSIVWRHDGKLLPEILPADATDAAADVHPSTTGMNSAQANAAQAHPALIRSFSRGGYEEAVRRVRAHIHEGDVYQVNLSQRFVFPLNEPPFDLWMRLFAVNPAPFYAFIEAGDHQVVSTSMERLFRIGKGRGRYEIESRPIKGTRPRGGDAQEDERIARELAASAKDDAELSMIVDLARNDIGRVCRAGSVRVREHKRIERYENVMHLVSVVDGALRADAGIADVFRALFPGGSITGCPKIRAMEIIDALEPVTRHVYTGSIGYLTADGTADFSIGIRTAVVRNGACHLSVGGGIVYDSDPAAEYEETLDKGRTFFRLAGISSLLDED